MYKIKDVARRGTALLGAVGLLTGISTSMLPAFASANALNPLTERSLTLSSSSPGWAYTDGSGNSTYAPPNSGANGQKTGNYFSFKMSSDTTSNAIMAMSFQYCTGSAGPCAAPGDNSPLTGSDTASTSDLSITYPSAAEIDDTETTGAGTMTLVSGSAAVTGASTAFTTDFVVGGTFKTAGGHIYVIKAINSPTSLTITDPSGAAASETTVTYKTGDFLQIIDPSTGLVKAVPGYTNHNPKYSGTDDPAEAAKNIAGNFIVMYKSGGTWVESPDWSATAVNQEENSTTTKNNTIILTNSGSGVTEPADTQLKVLFFATGTNYITNPGSGYYFVKINTFNSTFAPLTTSPLNTLADDVDPDSGQVIDGGVTVANVMNQSIQIQTKVLETMEFSVGTVDPDTLSSAQLAASAAGARKPCNTILTGMTSLDPQNVLSLGDQNQESSLSTTHTYATHSYWRLSSNSSAGATVYYSGHTLSNTSGDEVTPIGVNAAASAPGSEQFGLALDTMAIGGSTGVTRLDTGTYGVDYSTAGVYENAADNSATGVIAADGDPTHAAVKGVDNSVLTTLGADLVTPNYSALNKSYHTPKLDPLVPSADYGSGSGTITSSGTAQFAFDPMSDTVPAPIATENTQVVDCVTGKMRYIANIAATTPAGIYTTKVNYIAAPQY